MRVAVFSDHVWPSAARALAFATVAAGDNGPAHPSEPELHRRVNAGQRTYERLRRASPDLLMDLDGDGLLHLLAAGAVDPEKPIEFNPGYRAPLELRPLHQALGAPLASFFPNGIPISLADGQPGFDWPSLHLDGWFKFVADRAQVYELQQMGVPGLSYMPAAAPDFEYGTRPLEPNAARVPIAFVGSLRGGFFGPGRQDALHALTPGLMAYAHDRGVVGAAFYDVYHALLKMGKPCGPEVAPEENHRRLSAYLRARQAYLAICAVARRDRFVMLLKRQLGDVFQLFGEGWDAQYGLQCGPAPATLAEALELFRTALVNIDLPDEGCECGLSARVFEVTAAGGFLLALARPELAEHFEIGIEIETFHDEAELLDKCQHYLANPRRAAEIAAAGQRRTLQSHLYSHRLREIVRRLELPRAPSTASAAASEASAAYFNLGDWIDECRRVVPRPRVILDCGAFTGTTARLLRRAFPQAEIHSFEPVSANFAELERAAAELRVNAVRAAVSDQDGETTINLTAGGQSASLLGFQEERNPLVLYHKITGGERVRTLTLDRWCGEAGVDPRCIDIVKMDIQGAELRALAGARELLRHARAVFLEVGFRRFYKDMPLFEDVERFMRAAGFERRALYPSAAPSVWGDALYVRSATPPAATAPFAASAPGLAGSAPGIASVSTAC
ncbi:MAG: FkbM family methyltransferase [Phycisphaerae bacterium]|nr:FkbM family methyltransferase [Phycisphaerae bacterium]MCZ2399695.1 FkbM family methyltransferase [Phycisphaerae bacterium]NUQ49661.1 FkbM family methyltransferase [Phycisphaerae bacterium]